MLWREAHYSSSSCSLDSSIRHEVRLHRRVARRIDIPSSSGCVYHSHDWEIHYIYWIRRCIVKDWAKQSSSSWYQSSRLIIVHCVYVIGLIFKFLNGIGGIGWHNYELAHCCISSCLSTKMIEFCWLLEAEDWICKLSSSSRMTSFF
jgi:hypothetical protein